MRQEERKNAEADESKIAQGDVKEEKKREMRYVEKNG